MRWHRNRAEKASQIEIAMGEAAGDRLIEMTRIGAAEGAVKYVWVKGGTCSVTMPDGTRRTHRIKRRVGMG